MIKEKLIRLVQRSLAEGDVTSDVAGQYHELEIEQFLDMGFRTLMFDVFLQSKKYSDQGQLDVFARHYDNDGAGILIQKDDKSGEWYSELPVTIMDLPEQCGIRLVGPLGDDKVSYPLIANNSWHVFSKLEVSRTESGYFIEFRKRGEELRIIYRNYDEKVKLVKMMLIPSFIEYKWDEDVPIPAGKDKLLFDLVKSEVQEKKPTKMVNDNNPNT